MVYGRETSSHGDPLAVLDLGSNKFSCLIAQAGEDGQPEKILGWGFHAAAGMRGGRVHDLTAAEIAIRKAVAMAEDMAGLTVRDVYVATIAGRPQSWNFAVSLSLCGDRVTWPHVTRLQNAALTHVGTQDPTRKPLHAFALAYHLDGDVSFRPPIGQVGHNLAMDFHALVLDRDPLADLALAVEGAHLTPRAFVATPYASALGVLKEGEKQAGVACLDVGADMTSLAVFAGGHFVYGDAISVGSHHITQDIAQTLGISQRQAERIKTLHGTLYAAESDDYEVVSYIPFPETPDIPSQQISRARLSYLIRPRVGQILSFVMERLTKSGLAPYAGGRMVVTGGGAQLAGFARFVEERTGFAVRLGSPVRLPNLPARAASPAFSAAVGLLHYPSHLARELPVPEFPVAAQGESAGYLSRLKDWVRKNF